MGAWDGAADGSAWVIGLVGSGTSGVSPVQGLWAITFTDKALAGSAFSYNALLEVTAQRSGSLGDGENYVRFDRLIWDADDPNWDRSDFAPVILPRKYPSPKGWRYSRAALRESWRDVAGGK